LERVTGIEPVYSAWKAAVLPLYYTRTTLKNRGSSVEAHMRSDRCTGGIPMANRDGQSALMQSIAAVQVGPGGMFHGLLTKIG
jgi:hypothetical protein